MPQSVVYWQAYYDTARFIGERVYVLGPTHARLEFQVVLRYVRDEMTLTSPSPATEGRIDAMLDAVS